MYFYNIEYAQGLLNQAQFEVSYTELPLITIWCRESRCPTSREHQAKIVDLCGGEEPKTVKAFRDDPHFFSKVALSYLASKDIDSDI